MKRHRRRIDAGILRSKGTASRVVPWLTGAVLWTGFLVPADAAVFGYWSQPEQQAEISALELEGQTIAAIRFRGNRRVESEAMLLELSSAPGQALDRGKVGNDIRKLWELGYFSDIRVDAELTPAGVELIFVITERPTVRKVIVEGHLRVKLDDINEVLDLEKNEVLDLGKVAANVDKVRNLYAEQGFFLAEVNYTVREIPDEPGRIDVVLVISEAAEVVVRGLTFVGNSAISDEELRNHMFTRVGGFLSLISKKAGGVYNRELFAQGYARTFDGRLETWQHPPLNAAREIAGAVRARLLADPPVRAERRQP